MLRRVIAAALAACVCAWAAGTASGADAARLALARRVVAESPIRTSVAEAFQRGFERGLAKSGLSLSPYAVEKLKTAALGATEEALPRMIESMVAGYAAEFTEGELKRWIVIQNDPAMRKLRPVRDILASTKPEQTKQRELSAIVTDQELERIMTLASDPETQRIAQRSERIIQAVLSRHSATMDASVTRRLNAQCATAREALPWCARAAVKR